MRNEILRMGTYNGERLEGEVDKFLVKYGETILDNTEVCVLRRLESPHDQCKGCPSFIGCKKKYMTIAAIATLPITVIAEISSEERERICGDALETIKRIIQARTDKELRAIVPDIVKRM
jgi:hypothetical protein